MILVDSNVILDHATNDPVWYDWSAQILRKYHQQDPSINQIVFAEVAALATNIDEVHRLIEKLDLKTIEISDTGLFFAAKAHLKYRKNGGSRTSPLPGFFIGGHAQALGAKIITRDVKKYRTYFPKVELITP